MSNNNKRLQLESLINVTPIDLTVPFEFGKGTAFGLDPPVRRALLPEGAGCYADRIELCAHASGTHTECEGHVNPQGDFTDILKTWPPLTECYVLRVKCETLGESGESYEGSAPSAEPNEKVVSARALEIAFSRIPNKDQYSDVRSVVIMTLEPEWVFFTDQAIKWLVEKGITCLIIDKVSIDRERCGPKMPAHRGFFSNRNAIVTENVRQDESVKEGVYILSLQLSPILGTDAVPSRVLLYPIAD